MYKYLNFFNKKGEYANFAYDETKDKWTGRIDFGTVSEGIAEDFQLYILEEVFDEVSNQYEYSIPHIDSSFLPGSGSPVGPTGATANSVKINAYFDPAKPVEDIFIYSFELGPTENTLTRSYSVDYEFVFDATQTIALSNAPKPGIKQTVVSYPNAIQINIGFIPSEENGYSSTLYIKDISGHVFAEILVYGEAEEEDERLRDLLQSMGYDLLPTDSIIFDAKDVYEEDPDWRLINRKRKELLLEYANIFPYLGSYKALINVIKFFGYQNLRMKEYWLNIDATSVYYGKFKQINIADVFTPDANFNDSGLVPNKIYKKTNKFGLYYDITVESGEYDQDGIPIAEEVFSFSPQEILIKIYALKKKLQNYFLPVNAKIVDIIGEAVYFGKYDINVWNDQYRIDALDLGLKPKFSVLPRREGYLEDLRPLNFFGVPVGPDLTIGGQTNILSWRIGLATNDVVTEGPILDTVQTYRITFLIPYGSNAISVDTVIQTNPDTGQDHYFPFEVVDKMIENVNKVQYLKDNFVVYQEGGTSGVMRIVQKSNLGDGEIYVNWFSNSSIAYPAATIQFSSTVAPGPAGGTASSINVSTGPSGDFGAAGAPISYFGDAFLGYFDRSNIQVTHLNDDEDIPIGYPVVLRNDTFDITWDEANVTFNQIDQKNPLTNELLYSNFTVSSNIGWTSIYPHPDLPAGATFISDPVYTPVSGFPTYYPSKNVYSWGTLGNFGYHDMEWIVSKPETDTPAFYLKKRGTVDDYAKLPVILPYTGLYKVELSLWDAYNTKSFLINEDWIEVKIQDSDFIGWYQFRELEYNLDTERYPVQKDLASPTLPFGSPLPNENLTWDQYASTWDLPLHPNEAINMADISYNSLDSIEFYQSILNPSTNKLIDRFPYTFNLMTPLPNWNDLYHLWWDGTGTRITQWEINGATGPYVDIFMTRGNSTINLNSITANYVDGPTGFTGPTASYTAGNTGDILVSNANRKTYQWNGSEWVSIIDIVDSYRFVAITGTQNEKLRKMVNQLNSNMPIDGISHPYLTDFIYYYDEKYDNSYNLIPYIRAVSKNPDKNKRHLISYKGAIGSTASYNTVYFGYLGDIPTHFEIYQVNSTTPSGSININNSLIPYPIGSTNLTDLCNELNGPVAQSYEGIKNYTYNLVMGHSGMIGPSGSTAGAYPVMIQGVSKAFTSPDEITIEYTGGIVGTTYGRSLIKNPSWDQIRILKYTKELPLCTVVNFTYDNSKMHGKKNPVWILQKDGDPDFADIYYNNKYFSYMFTERGSYTLTLNLEDTNGNKQTVTKKEIIKII